MVANGEFSVLVANRFPPPGGNTVYLVSLEGWNDLLDAPGQASAASRVRLITLASWSFRERSDRPRHVRRVDADN